MSLMRRAGSLRLAVASALTLGGCSTGVSDEAGPVTFGPYDPNATTHSASTSEPPGSTSRGSDEGRPDSSGRPSEDTGTGSTTGGSGATCGNGVLEPGEVCDGKELGGLRCPDADPMFTGGTLACDGMCALEISGCSAVPNPIVECVMVGMPIPDIDPAGLTSTIPLPPEAQGLTIVDVDVDVVLEHTYIGDLVIDVSHLDGTVLLFEGCTNDMNIDATFDDEAGTAFECEQSAAALAFRPFASLSAFDGVPTSDGLTLFVEDTLEADTGTLQQWCVTITWE